MKELLGYRFVANDWSKTIHSVKHSNKRCSIYEQKNGRYVTRDEAEKLINEQEYVACVCTKKDGMYRYPEVKRTLTTNSDVGVDTYDVFDAKGDTKNPPIPRTGGGTHP